MRLAHERSECDIHGARKGYLAHGKACLKCGLNSRSAINAFICLQSSTGFELVSVLVLYFIKNYK